MIDISHRTGKPDKPTRLTISNVGSTQMTLSWTKPDCDDRVAIQGYTVEYKEVTRGDWIKANREPSVNTTLTVTNLTEGSGYQFHVCAENAIGKGIFSDASDVCKTGEIVNCLYSSVFMFEI